MVGAQCTRQHQCIEARIDGLDDGFFDSGADGGEAVTAHQDDDFVWIGLCGGGGRVREVGGEGVTEFDGIDEHEAGVGGVVYDLFIPIGCAFWCCCR